MDRTEPLKTEHATLLQRIEQLSADDPAAYASGTVNQLRRVVASLEQAALDQQRLGHLGATWAASNRAAERT